MSCWALHSQGVAVSSPRATTNPTGEERIVPFEFRNVTFVLWTRPLCNQCSSLTKKKQVQSTPLDLTVLTRDLRVQILDGFPCVEGLGLTDTLIEATQFAEPRQVRTVHRRGEFVGVGER